MGRRRGEGYLGVLKYFLSDMILVLRYTILYVCLHLHCELVLCLLYVVDLSPLPLFLSQATSKLIMISGKMTHFPYNNRQWPTVVY